MGGGGGLYIVRGAIYVYCKPVYMGGGGYYIVSQYGKVGGGGLYYCKPVREGGCK